MDELLDSVRRCCVCRDELPLGPNPVVRASREARIIIIGQAPGTKVHRTGIPWNDPSGDLLREWMQLDRQSFYDETRIAIKLRVIFIVYGLNLHFKLVSLSWDDF